MNVGKRIQKQGMTLKMCKIEICPNCSSILVVNYYTNFVDREIHMKCYNCGHKWQLKFEIKRDE
jgi:RNase P subunit RPR2